MSSQTSETPMVSLKSKESKIGPTIRHAIEITKREGYSVGEWMWALNLAAGNVPQNLRTSAKILAALSTGQRC